MTRIKHKMDEKAFKRVSGVLSSIDTPETMSRFLKELLTPGEMRDIALRWRLLEMLAEGVPQRRIAEKLQISLCKITRGSKILKQKDTLTSQVLGGESAPR